MEDVCSVIGIQILCYLRSYSTKGYYFSLIYSTVGNVSAGESRGRGVLQSAADDSIRCLKNSATGIYEAACWLCFRPSQQ